MGDILLTGAAGGVCAMIRPLLRARYGRLVLSDLNDPGDLADGEEFRQADLNDPEQLDAAMAGCDRVIHMGGQSVEADWQTVLDANIRGLFSTFEAARRAGVGRLVFASSVHAVGFYSRQRRIGIDDRVRPDTRYGLSKVFGEGLSSLYADKHGMRNLSIRIGHVAPHPMDMRRLSIWVHPEDLVQLIAIGLEHPAIHNQVIFGASGNARGWWDNHAAFDLGYRPGHDAEDWLQQILDQPEEPDAVADTFQGGTFAAEEFDGDAERSRWS